MLAASLAVLPAQVLAQGVVAQPSPSVRASAAPPLSLLDVPFLSQSEALCGGAAVAMVLRYWGATGVAAEDFAPLVDRAKGGIETSVLARAVRERGYQALPAAGTAALARRELAQGRPVIALIEDRPGAFHYVVLVGWHARAVVLHDPARTPYILLRPDELERRWRVSGNWMLAVAPRTASPGSSPSPGSESPLGAPAPSRGSESLLGVPAPSRGSESPLGVPAPSDGAESPLGAPAPSPGAELPVGSPAQGGACDVLVAGGVQAAQQNDLPSAERLLADAAYQCAGAAALRELAGVRLLQRRWPEVRDLAGRAVAIDPADAHAWRLLATARYIEGNHPGALDAWNRVGEPVVDLVTASGLQRTSHRVVEQVLGVGTGAVLTRPDFDRARRRLGEMPAAAAMRLEYLPRPSGAAEVRAHVVERNVVPRGALTWAAIGLRAAASREVALGFASLGRSGERLDASWRFWPHRPAAAVALHVPGRLGLLSLELSAERQPFNDLALADAERLATAVRFADWATAAFRWELRSGFSRWRGIGSFGTVGGAARVEHGRAWGGAAVDAWLGDDRFAAVAAHAGWRSSTARRGFAFEVSGALETVGGATAPLDVWPSGDTGHARRTLLRAHPVLDDGRLRVERLGRHLLQGTVEA
ncbi:MAG: C39 family peptidase, partial [Vicinamibacterales bacterium]